MHIAFVITSLRRGGAENSAVKTIKVIHNNGHATTAIILSDCESELLAQVPKETVVYVLRARKTLNPLLWLRVHRILRNDKPDVVVGWSTYANFVGIVVSLYHRRWKLILSERIYWPPIFAENRMGSIRKKVIQILMRLLYPKADLITANSQRNVRFLTKFIGRGPLYFHLPNTVDVADALNLAEQPPEITIPELTGPHILGLGRLDYQKGFDVMLEALALIRVHYPWKLLLVGDGPDRCNLEAKAYALGVANAVYWIGEVANPFPYYRWADMVVLPSRYEGFPNVALEAMACARTVVCFDCPSGPKELTQNGRYGVLVKKPSAEALATAILKMGLNGKERTKLGVEAQYHVKDKYDFSAIDQLYAKVLLPV
jgi:GalNAc-alpha-(1->4)-GalNAc-alpha-(1->3)-diNAcBac-PP-undecaprenol alpha-1,4-N-acetyl-D-galactosaminyltransferase